MGYVTFSNLCVLSLVINHICSLGEFIYISFLGMPMLIVQDREIADELMNKRGNQYSYRPRSVMCGDLCVLHNKLSTSYLPQFYHSMGWGGWLPALLQPGKQHTESRRLFQKGLSVQAVSTYKDLIDTTNIELLKWALDHSSDPEPIVSKYVRNSSPEYPDKRSLPETLLCVCTKPTGRAIGRILVGVAYGDSLTREEEAKLLASNREALAITTRAFANIYLVDFIPARKSNNSYLFLDV